MFQGHKDAVSGLAFRRHTHQLFSSSFDRTVKVYYIVHIAWITLQIWNLDEMAYVETLYVLVSFS
jgi:ribosomal RNA-processing protein 9